MKSTTEGSCPDEREMINLAYITSCREVGIDELIGREVIDPDNGVNYGDREGNLESLARLLIDGNSEFAGQFNLTAVIIDDDDEQYNKAWSSAELWPRDLRVPIRDSSGLVTAEPTLEEITVRIPSQPWKNFRRFLNCGETIELFKERKVAAKSNYEMRMLDELMERDVDLVISDSYTTIFADVMLNNYPGNRIPGLNGYGGRIINIHPAITQVGDPDRLPGLTPTRDAFTRAVHGYIIVDDKHAVDIPEGERIEVKYYDRLREAVRVPKSNRTGVTVHIVTDEVDNGPVIVCRSYEFNPEGITPEAIRNRNYEIKREIIPEAIMEYAQQIRPVIDLVHFERATSRIYLEHI